jgi:hypothetical protein
MLVKSLIVENIKKGVKKLKVPHYASAAAACNGNLTYVKATCLI